MSTPLQIYMDITKSVLSSLDFHLANIPLEIIELVIDKELKETQCAERIDLLNTIRDYARTVTRNELSA